MLDRFVGQVSVDQIFDVELDIILLLGGDGSRIEHNWTWQSNTYRYSIEYCGPMEKI
jgi:hypothetical protein